MNLITQKLILRSSANEKKNIVITGSSKGIGKAIAKKCFIDGHNVIISSRNKENTLSAYQEFMELSKDNDNCGFVYPFNADVTVYKDCEKLIEQCMNKLGHIDIWINNSGVSTKNELINLSNNNIDSIIDTNLKGTIYCCNLLIPIMMAQDRQGIIINFEGAGSNSLPTPEYSVYGATKSAITQFTKTLSLEYSKSNIHFCTISPGMVVTELLLSNCTDKMKTIFNIFAEKPEKVAKYLVAEIYKIRSNTHIRYLTFNRICLLLISYLISSKYKHFNKKGELKE